VYRFHPKPKILKGNDAEAELEHSEKPNNGVDTLIENEGRKEDE